MDVVLRRQDSRILTFPYLKDPRLSRHLSVASAHPFDIHLSWPRMLLKRAELLTNSDDACANYKAELGARLKNDGCISVRIAARTPLSCC